MKRLLAIFLCLMMLLSLFACGGATIDTIESGDTSTTTDDEDENVGKDEEDDGDDTTTSSTSPTTSTTTPPTTSSTTNNGGDDDQPTGPVLTPDRTQYKAETVGSGNNIAIYYADELVKAPYLTPYYRGYTAALTMTFDDGYDLGTGTVVSDQFERFGYRGTMMLGACFLGNDEMIAGWNQVFARGYLDVGCHGYDHQEPTTLDKSQYEHEIKDAIMFLREKFPGQRVLTFATPYAHINNSYEEYLSQFVIGNRLEAGGQQVGLGENLNFNPYRVKAVSVNTRANMTDIRNAVNSAVKYGRWIVELYHCVKDQASGVDMERTEFVKHCEWLYRNHRDNLWVATFEEVLVYAEELRHTTLEYTHCDRESMTFTVTPDGTLDKEIYNIPLSMMIYLPSELSDSAYVTVNGVAQAIDIQYESDTGYKYALVHDIPATEKSDVVVHIGGNSTMKNNCGRRHSYVVIETVEATHDSFGYTVNQCTKCEHEYISGYTNPVHDYTGRQEVVLEGTLTKKGLSKQYCAHCDKYIVVEVAFAPTEE